MCRWPGLNVGYVMGVGDEVPAAITQLGATVHLLSDVELASGDLARFDTIITGTRAYAVRADLQAHNDRLLAFVKAGGNLVVLYNTPEFTPATLAPFPASLPDDAEEVCEEGAAVEILTQADPLLLRPNRIGPSDFAGWIEQRGSKFFATWDAQYTPLSQPTIAANRRNEAACCTRGTGKGAIHAHGGPRSTGNCRPVCPGLTGCSLI